MTSNTLKWITVVINILALIPPLLPLLGVAISDMAVVGLTGFLLAVNSILTMVLEPTPPVAP